MLFVFGYCQSSEQDPLAKRCQEQICEVREPPGDRIEAACDGFISLASRPNSNPAISQAGSFTISPVPFLRLIMALMGEGKKQFHTRAEFWMGSWSQESSSKWRFVAKGSVAKWSVAKGFAARSKIRKRREDETIESINLCSNAARYLLYYTQTSQ